MGLKLAPLETACAIDMIQTSRPGGVCRQTCIHCGAFTGNEKGQQIQLSKGELERNLSREVPAVKEGIRAKIVANYLAPFVTTDVNVEPTDGDAFLYAADLVDTLTEGGSKMLCISHGVRSYIRPSKEADSQYVTSRGEKRDFVRDILALFDTTTSFRDADFHKGIDRSALETIVVDRLINEGLPDALFDAIEDALQGRLDPARAMSTYLDATGFFVGKGLLEEIKSCADDLAAERLQRIVELIQKGKVAGFILTIDFARSMGRISLESNAVSFIETLNLLKPALAANCPGFVAVSIQGLQGDDVPSEHPYSATRAHVFFQEILNRSNLTPAEKAKIRFDTGRNYAKVGKAAAEPVLAQWLGADDACEVIPCQQFVDSVVAKGRKHMRARLCADGSAEWQYVDAGRTYNTTIQGPWNKFLDVPPLCQYTKEGVARALSLEAGGALTKTKLSPAERARKRTFSWESPITQEDDVFLIKPFSVLRRRDRQRVLEHLRTCLGVADICTYRIRDPKTGQERPLMFTDLKFLFLKALYPHNDLGAKITAASPYREVLDRISQTGEQIGVILGDESYYAGEILALAKAIEGACGITYLVKDLDNPALDSVESSSDDSESQSPPDSDTIVASGGPDHPCSKKE